MSEKPQVPHVKDLKSLAKNLGVCREDVAYLHE